MLHVHVAHMLELYHYNIQDLHVTMVSIRNPWSLGSLIYTMIPPVSVVIYYDISPSTDFGSLGNGLISALRLFLNPMRYCIMKKKFISYLSIKYV